MPGTSAPPTPVLSADPPQEPGTAAPSTGPSSGGASAVTDATLPVSRSHEPPGQLVVLTIWGWGIVVVNSLGLLLNGLLFLRDPGTAAIHGLLSLLYLRLGVGLIRWERMAVVAILILPWAVIAILGFMLRQAGLGSEVQVMGPSIVLFAERIPHPLLVLILIVQLPPVVAGITAWRHLR